MTGRRLIFSNDKEIENGEAGLADNILHLWIPDMTMIEAAQLVLDPAKTIEIRFQYGEMEDVYNGYTSCHGIAIDDGQISVRLKKGEE